jgi:hypothetical protein
MRKDEACSELLESEQEEDIKFEFEQDTVSHCGVKFEEKHVPSFSVPGLLLRTSSAAWK